MREHMDSLRRVLNKIENKRKGKKPVDVIPREKGIPLSYLRMICEYARAMGRLLRELDGQDSPRFPRHLKYGKYSSGQPQIYRSQYP